MWTLRLCYPKCKAVPSVSPHVPGCAKSNNFPLSLLQSCQHVMCARSPVWSLRSPWTSDHSETSSPWGSASFDSVFSWSVLLQHKCTTLIYNTICGSLHIVRVVDIRTIKPLQSWAENVSDAVSDRSCGLIGGKNSLHLFVGSTMHLGQGFSKLLYW